VICSSSIHNTNFSPDSEPTRGGPEFKDIWIVWSQMTFLGLLSQLESGLE
jgi:hypothetical protein